MIFEGRGWDNKGHSFFDALSISVIVIGRYSFTKPPDGVGRAIRQLSDDGLALGKLTDDYKINGREGVGGDGPSFELMKQIKTWERYGNATNYS